MKITKGKQTRAQRVVIYGVESVGKSTFAAQFPRPLFLDIEGGTATWTLTAARSALGSN
jgi:GTPase SAR1 family protein